MTVETGNRSAAELLAWSRALVEPELRAAVDTLPGPIRTMTGYHLGWWDAAGEPATGAAGKSLRPALALLAAGAVGGDPAAARPAAVAVELVHNFSLIQDDVIDGDLTRRHRPTVWSVFGPGAAIVAGDGLLSLAGAVVTAGAGNAREAQAMLHTAVLALLHGQTEDLAFERRAEVTLADCLAMAEAKCGALLGCACGLGAWCAGGTTAQVDGLRRFGERLGVAFQLADDLLGIWGDPAVTGKPVHADLQRRKKSLPVVAALASGTPAGDELAAIYYRDRPLAERELTRAAALVEEAGGRRWGRERAGELLADALAQLTAAGSGRAAADLATLARLAVHRDH